MFLAFVVFTLALLGLSIVSVQLSYDLYTIPPLFGGSVAIALSQVWVGNHSYFQKQPNTSVGFCAGTLGCANLFCDIQTRDLPLLVGISPNTCFQPGSVTLLSFMWGLSNYFKTFQIYFYLTLALTLCWGIILLFVKKVKNYRVYIAIFSTFYVSSVLSNFLTFLFYWIYRLNYSSLTQDYLPNYLFISALFMNSFYMIVYIVSSIGAFKQIKDYVRNRIRFDNFENI